MAAPQDPFEAFREKRKFEELEKRARSSPQVKCPAEAEPDGRPASRKTSGLRQAFDASRVWIY